MIEPNYLWIEIRNPNNRATLFLIIKHNCKSRNNVTSCMIVKHIFGGQGIM